MKYSFQAPVLMALLAALLFGASAPAAKFLLGEVEPVLLAGLLYLGSGLSVLVLKAMRRPGGANREAEAPLRRTDLPWLAGALLLGGVAAPILLMSSLQNTPAATAALLLNFESVATTLVAVLLFRESAGRRIWWAVLLISAASALLSLAPGAGWGFSAGALGILGACLLWGLDNNFTRNISARDPLSIVCVKGLGAGSVSLAIALGRGASLPPLAAALGALLLGALSYGMSIALFVRALRALGAARTSALFSTAPLAGLLLSFALLHEAPAPFFPAALVLMAAGTWLLVSEEHVHEHLHPALQHEHAHAHDDGHHDHGHTRVDAGVEEGVFRGSHSHVHMHSQTLHAHRHSPDIHHRHTHEDK